MDAACRAACCASGRAVWTDRLHRRRLPPVSGLARAPARPRCRRRSARSPGLIELDAGEARAASARGFCRRRARDSPTEQAAAGARSRDPHRGPSPRRRGIRSPSPRETAIDAVGGIEPLSATLEDAGFADRLARHGVPLLRSSKVRTSAGPHGRVGRELSVDLAVASWLERGRYELTDFNIAQLQSCQGRDEGDGVPAKECARTIPGVLRHTTDATRRMPASWTTMVVVDAGIRRRNNRGSRLTARGARRLQQDQLRLAARPGARQG